MDKHGSQLGRYRLIRVQGGRPIYQHLETEAQFLYYHPYSGGNWLINSEVGLLYGGIQNSKDSPLCPYLINTVSLPIFSIHSTLYMSPPATFIIVIQQITTNGLRLGRSPVLPSDHICHGKVRSGVNLGVYSFPEWNRTTSVPKSVPRGGFG